MNDRRRRFRFSLPLLWDGLMVYLAIVNVLFIGFDHTYLWFRAFYVNNVPWVARHYDPVKGIEPFPFTADYLAQVEVARALVEGGAPAPQVTSALESCGGCRTS